MLFRSEVRNLKHMAWPFLIALTVPATALLLWLHAPAALMLGPLLAGIVFAAGGGTVRDLAAAELCYAPQFGAAKDPVNLAGMIASNHLDGDMPLADWRRIEGAVLVDVREPQEYAAGHVAGAMNLPLSVLRERHGELPRDRDVAVYCQVGQRGYFATRFLQQQGLRVANLSGGYTTWLALHAVGLAPGESRSGERP